MPSETKSPKSVNHQFESLYAKLSEHGYISVVDNKKVLEKMFASGYTVALQDLIQTINTKEEIDVPKFVFKRLAECKTILDEQYQGN